MKSSSRYRPTAFAANNHTRTLPLPIFLSILPKSPWQNTISGWPSTFPTASQHTRASQLHSPHSSTTTHTHTTHNTLQAKVLPSPQLLLANYNLTVQDVTIYRTEPSPAFSARTICTSRITPMAHKVHWPALPTIHAPMYSHSQHACAIYAPHRVSYTSPPKFSEK